MVQLRRESPTAKGAQAVAQKSSLAAAPTWVWTTFLAGLPGLPFFSAKHADGSTRTGWADLCHDRRLAWARCVPALPRRLWARSCLQTTGADRASGADSFGWCTEDAGSGPVQPSSPVFAGPGPARDRRAFAETAPVAKKITGMSTTFVFYSYGPQLFPHLPGSKG